MENIQVNDQMVHPFYSADGGEKGQGTQGAHGPGGHEAAQQLVPRHQGEFLGEPGLQVHRLHVDASPSDPCERMKTAGILNPMMCKEVKIPVLGEQLAHSL